MDGLPAKELERVKEWKKRGAARIERKKSPALRRNPATPQPSKCAETSIADVAEEKLLA